MLPTQQLIVDQQIQNNLLVLLSDKELELRHRKREADDALDSVRDAQTSKEQKEADKRDADKKFDSMRDELKACQIAGGVTAGLCVVGSILTFGLGAGPGGKITKKIIMNNPYLFTKCIWSQLLHSLYCEYTNAISLSCFMLY